MRIGVNTLFLVPGDVGGTETYLRRILSHMTSALGGDTLVLFTTLENDKLLRSDLENFSGVEFHQLGFRAANRPLRILLEQFWLPLIVKKCNVQVLWSPGYIAPAVCPCPQAVTVHDLQYKKYPEDINIAERATLALLVKVACRVCRSVLTISEFSRQEIIRYGLAPAERITAIYSGVSREFAKQEEEKTTGTNLDTIIAGHPYILCVSHTYPHKNIHMLIDAFGLVHREIPHSLLLVGKGRRGEEQVQKSLAGLEGTCKDRVQRLSNLDFGQLKALYQNADLFVFPSGYEGFGLPVLEAMMAGTSVVTTREASLPEVGGPHVTYADQISPEAFAETIMRVVGRPAREKRKREEAAKKWAVSFSWDVTASTILGVLRQIADDTDIH